MARHKKRNRRWLNLTPRRRKLIKNLLSGRFKTKKDALISAGYAVSTAEKIPHRIIGNDRFLTAVQYELERQGITDAKLVKKIDEGLEANKVISALVVAGNGEGMADASGVTKDFIEVPDYFVRHKYLETALNLRGDFPDKKVQVEATIETHEQRLARLRGQIGEEI